MNRTARKDPVTHTAIDPGAEFDRQVHNLVERDCPTMARLTPEQFSALVTPLRDLATDIGHGVRAPDTGRVPFLLVVTREVVPIERTMARTALRGKTDPGFVDRSFEPGALERFVAVKETGIPDRRAYLLLDVERGEEFRGAPYPATPWTPSPPEDEARSPSRRKSR
jgi:hypothetical protein